MSDLDNEIEELELHDMSEKDIERTVQAFSKEGLELRALRKKVRYQLYRLRTEAEGKCASNVPDKFKKSFEAQEGFDGWRAFATTWDVAIADPSRVISRHLSEAEEWDNVVKSKFPQIRPDGEIVYPDLKVKAKVQKEAKKRRGSK